MSAAITSRPRILLFSAAIAAFAAAAQAAQAQCTLDISKIVAQEAGLPTEPSRIPGSAGPVIARPYGIMTSADSQTAPEPDEPEPLRYRPPVTTDGLAPTPEHATVPEAARIGARP